MINRPNSSHTPYLKSIRSCPIILGQINSHDEKQCGSHKMSIDHCFLRPFIGQKGWGRPSSTTRRWRLKGPRKSSWTDNLHGFRHDVLWFFMIFQIWIRPTSKRYLWHKVWQTMLVAWFLDEYQGPSQVHGNIPWLVCENQVAFSWKCSKGRRLLDPHYFHRV